MRALLRSLQLDRRFALGLSVRTSPSGRERTRVQLRLRPLSALGAAIEELPLLTVDAGDLERIADVLEGMSNAFNGLSTSEDASPGTLELPLPHPRSEALP
jgi:hypothetical protein